MPPVPEPLPVRVIAVADVRLPAPAGAERQMDAFSVGLLGFERAEPPHQLIYRSENFLLSFDVIDRPVPHESLRPLGIEIPSLGEAEKKLIEAEIEYTRQRGLTPGSQTLLVLDPAGNWVELMERGEVR